MQAHSYPPKAANFPLSVSYHVLLLGVACIFSAGFCVTPAAAQREWLPTLGVGYAYDAADGPDGHGGLISAGSETRWLNGLSVGVHSGVRLLGFPEGAAGRQRFGVPLDLQLGYALDIVTLVPSIHGGLSGNLDLGAGARAQVGVHGTAMLAYAVDFDHRIALAVTYRYWLAETPSPSTASGPSGELEHSVDIALRWIWVLW